MRQEIATEAFGQEAMTQRPNANSARQIRIGLRVSEEEALEMKEQAEASRLTLSEYARRRILGKRIVPQSDMNVLAELRRLGGLLKHIHNETRGMYSE